MLSHFGPSIIGFVERDIGPLSVKNNDGGKDAKLLKFFLECMQFIYWPGVNPSPITTIRQLNFDYQGQVGRLVAANGVIHTKLVQFHDIHLAGLFRYNQLLSYRGYAANAGAPHRQLFRRLAALPFCPRHGVPLPLP